MPKKTINEKTTEGVMDNMAPLLLYVATEK